MSKKIVFLILMLILIPVTILFAAFSNLGKEFILCYPANACREPSTPGTPASHWNGQIILTSTVATIGTVQTLGGALLEEFTIPAFGTATVSVDSSLWLRNSETIYNRGISIRSQDTIAAYFLAFEEPGATNDMTLLFPNQSLGQEYIVMCWRDNIPTIGYTNRGPSMLAIVAPNNSTNITITPSVNTAGGHSAGVPFTIVLDSHDAYQVLANSPSRFDMSDLTGTEIISDKPIAVFGGSQIALVPDSIMAADYMIEQMTPITAWGMNFNAFPIEMRQTWQRDVLKIVASEDMTTVTIYDSTSTGPAEVISLNRGEFFEWDGTPCDPGLYDIPFGGGHAADCAGKLLDSPTRIVADKPILVGQFVTGGVLTKGEPSFITGSGDVPLGDPAFMLIPPEEQYARRYVFLIPPGYTNDYLNVVIEEGFESTVLLDGAPPTFSTPWFDIPLTTRRGARIEVDPGNHVIEADTIMLLQMYAFDDAWASYAAVAGQNIKVINAGFEIRKECILTPAVCGYHTTWRIILHQMVGVGSHVITIGDTLPSGFTLSSNPVDIQLFGSATRDSISEPTPGDSILSWGWFSMEEDDSIVITFDADIELGIVGTFDNGVWIANAFGYRADNAFGLLDSIDDVNVVMPPMPIADAGTDTVIYIGTEVTIGGDPTATSGTPPYEIAWTSDPPGFTSDSANPLVSPGELTEYIVCVTDSFGFVDCDTCYVDIVMQPRHLNFGMDDGAPCDTVIIPLFIDNLVYCRLDSAHMSFSVDPAVLTPIGIDVAGAMADGWLVSGVAIDESLGTIEARMSGASLADMPAGVLLDLIARVNCDARGGSTTPVVVESFIFNDGFPEVTWEPGFCYVQLTTELFSCDIRLNRLSGPITPDNTFTFGGTPGATEGYDPGIDWVLVPPPSTYVQGEFMIDDPEYSFIHALRKDVRAVSAPQVWNLATFGEAEGIAKWNSSTLPEGEFYINGIYDMKAESVAYFGGDETLVIEWTVPELEPREMDMHSGWNMVSSPLHPVGIPAEDVFAGAYGVYRFNTPTGSYEFAEWIMRGEGYWVWFDEDTSIYVVGAAFSNYSISIFRGWNLIGALPYAIATSDLSTVPPGIILGDIYGWDCPPCIYSAADSILPGRAYWLLSVDNGLLTIPDSSRRRPEPEIVPEWESEITLDFGGSVEILSIAFSEQAREGLDRGDIAFPPVPPSGEGRRAWLDEDGFALRYDISPGAEWELVLNGPAYMSMRVPEGRDILIDGDVIESETPLLLEIGLHRINAVPVLPECFDVLGCAPNPFNSATDIMVALPEHGVVEVDIFNLSGRLIWRNSGEYPAGIAKIVWSGESIDNCEASSGLYFARVSYNGNSEIVRAMLIK